MSIGDRSDSEFRNLVGSRISLAREAHGMTQADVARRMKLHPSAISQMESGVRMPSIGSLRQLADALDVSADYLIGRTIRSDDQPIDPIKQVMERLSSRDRAFLGELIERLARDSHRVIPDREPRIQGPKQGTKRIRRDR